MVSRQWRRSALGAALALLVSPLIAVVATGKPALADNGTILRTITAQSPACGVGTGIAFDGKQLLLSCDGSSQVWGVSPDDGTLLNTYLVANSGSLGALAWDRGRNELWACENYYNVVRISLITQLSTQAFTSDGCRDGLAYDGSDDTIWSSADAASSAQHYKLDGTLIQSFDVSTLLGDCGNSGIAVGGSRLLLANDGCSQIYLLPKTVDSSTLFGTYPARLEDLECDDVTFASAGKAAIWSKDAYDNILNAFELNPGTCGYGGFSSSHDELLATNSSETAIAVNPTDPTNLLSAYNTKVDGILSCGWSTSYNGGETWPDKGVLQPPTGFSKMAGDPSVAFTSDGVAYVGCMANRKNGTSAGGVRSPV